MSMDVLEQYRVAYWIRFGKKYEGGDNWLRLLLADVMTPVFAEGDTDRINAMRDLDIGAEAAQAERDAAKAEETKHQALLAEIAALEAQLAKPKSKRIARK